MKIPLKIRVGPHVYKVKEGHKFTENPALCGQTRHGAGQILLGDTDQSGAPATRSQIEQTFFHELMHCVVSVYNGRREMEEAVVDALATGLYQALNDARMLR